MNSAFISSARFECGIMTPDSLQPIVMEFGPDIWHRHTASSSRGAVVGKKSAKNVDLIWSAAGLAVSVWMGYFNDVTIGRSKRRLLRWPSVSPLSAEILMVGADRDFPYGIKQTLTLSTSKWKICWKINLVVNALAAFCSLSLYLREIFRCDFSEVSVCMQ